MKNSKRISRVRLDDSQPDEYIFMGLVSSEPDYKLSLLINKSLNISLKNTLPVSSPEVSAGSIFSRFVSSSGNSGPGFSLVSNRHEKDFFIKKLRNIDYIFISLDPEKEINPENLATDLRGIESVTAVFRLDPEILKDKNVQYLIH